MGPKNESQNKAFAGFEGSVAGLGLTDVIELSANNHFSGCVSVRHGPSSGLIFFRDGEVIHAEQDGIRGEQAFYEIMRWPGGKFSLEPNVATTSRTIDRSWKFLLMEALRLMDERSPGRPAAHEAASSSPASGSGVPMMQRIQEIPGVAYAVLLGKDGKRVGDDSYQAETLEGQTAYLVMLGRRLGEIFNVGDILAATVQGTEQHLLLLGSRSHDLCVLVEGTGQPGAVEAEIRRLLTPRR